MGYDPRMTLELRWRRESRNKNDMGRGRIETFGTDRDAYARFIELTTDHSVLYDLMSNYDFMAVETLTVQLLEDGIVDRQATINIKVGRKPNTLDEFTRPIE